MNEEKQKGIIPTYFSHSYRAEDRDVNLFFWQLFWDAGFLFTVDPKSEVISIPYLETMVRRSACFAAVIPLRNEEPTGCSPYILWEYGLAVQAQKPILAFVEKDANEYYFPKGKPGIFYYNKERLRNDKDEFIREISNLAKKGLPYKRIDVQPHGKVGLLLISNKRNIVYSKGLLDKLQNLLKKKRYTPEFIDLSFDQNFEFALRLDQYDFIILDVSPNFLPSWVYPFIYGRFVPSIKLIHLPYNSANLKLPKLVSGQLFKSFFEGSDSVIYWRNEDQLFHEIEQQLKKFSTERKEFHSFEEGFKYFKSLGLRRDNIFISNASDFNHIANKISSKLKEWGIEPFHYIDENKIPLGEKWEEQLPNNIKTSQIFVALISKGYLESPYCRKEEEIALRRYKEGKLKFIPYYLEKVAVNYDPQGRNFSDLIPEEQVERILSDIENMLKSKDFSVHSKQSLNSNRKQLLEEGQMDIAIVTILPEEYQAVLDKLDQKHRPRPQKNKPDLYAWMLGEIKSPSYTTPFKVVVGMTAKPGNVSGAKIIEKAISRWKPRYILLVGIAGGLPREKLEKGDVVISQVIWGYEYGKVKKRFHPRTDWTYPVDDALLRNALALAVREPDWAASFLQQHDQLSQSPKVVVGPIASGDKVVDDASSDFFKQVLKQWPKLQAIEMEGAGAASAINEATSEGHTVGFLMIRGISDMPLTNSHHQKGNDKAKSQTIERDAWKCLAAESAAAFTVHFIRNAWPLPPAAEE